MTLCLVNLNERDKKIITSNITTEKNDKRIESLSNKITQLNNQLSNLKKIDARSNKTRK